MKHSRNKMVDILRSVALLSVLIYHIYIITGLKSQYEIINSLISMGGEIGVSIFFVISGYSIYNNLSNKKYICWLDFIKDRLKKIAPHYYLSLLVMLLFTNCAIYLSKDFILGIISHLFFFHNLFYSCHGAINGVLWTMGVIFQFYLLAPLLKKVVDKKPIIALLGSLAISIGIKYILYKIIFPLNNLDSMYYFIYGRQIFTTIDAFVLGMLASKFSTSNNNNIISLLCSICCIITITFITLCGSNYFTLLGDSELYSSSFKGVIFFIILDSVIALLIYFISSLKIKESPLVNIMLFISKHEYSIYVWHLLVLTPFINYSTFYQDLKANNHTLTYVVLVILLITIGYIIDIFVSNVDFLKIKEKISEQYNKIKEKLNIFFIIIILGIALSFVPKIIKNIKQTEQNISKCEGSCIIYEKSIEKMKCDREQCEYIYLDKEDTGYLYFYQLRYYFSPYKTIHYNSYVYTINYAKEEEFFEYIKGLEVDFVLVKDNDFLREYGYNLDTINGKVYRINKDAKNIKTLLEEVS